MTLQYIGSPETQSGPIDATIGASGGPTFAGSDGQLLASRFTNTHDVLAHFTSKLAERRLQLDVIAGYHLEDQKLTPNGAAGGNDANITYTNEMGLIDFRPDLSPCARTTTAAGNTFNPCPVTSYVDGGWGIVDHMTVHRAAVSAAATYFARWAGTHALKVGFDFEDNIYTHFRVYTGGGVVLTDPAAEFPLTRSQFASQSSASPTDNATILDDGLTSTTQSINLGAYLRDSYNVSFIPGLTLNAGVRWEAQQITDLDGAVKIGIYDNWAPRVGAIWDFTRKGRGKLFANYGWYYESIPIDIADRSFSREGFAQQQVDRSGCAPGAVDANGRILDIHKCDFGTIQNQSVLGGTFAPVAPALKGQYSEEVVAGIQYDVGLDLVLGASYIHRGLGRVIEDLSPDGGHTYFISNPGDSVDEGAVASLQRQIASTSDPAKKATLQQQLQLYQQIGVGYPKPTRNYDALVLTATKRLSHNFLLLASYTYSRSIGNYPGLFQASNGQTDPNISTQYDFRELLVNRDGPLPNDRPHNIKVQGSYFIPFGSNSIVLGLAFNANSGTPIEVLGASPQIGESEVFVLPRGSGGRTPWVTQLDLHVSYRRKLSAMFSFEAYADVFNVLNQQAVTGVDEEYTFSVVGPVQNGHVADLANLKTIGGGPVIVNPNYGSATSFQQPLSLRLGLRVSF
ncbi:MAG TPA: TonB-dependent receptor [Polyangia bacterium]